MNIVIVMPTYNEAENIGSMVGALCGKAFPEIAASFPDVEMHLLVVDDASPDGTGEIVAGLMKNYDNLHLLTGRKEGLGHAYIRGFIYAMKFLSADAVIEMDADFQHNPVYVGDFVDAFVRGADYVIGSRYIKGGSIPDGWEWYRRLVSNYGNSFAGFMLRLPGITDMTTGFRLTRVKGLLDKIDLRNLMAPEHFAYKVDLMYKTAKLSRKTVEIPIHFKEREKETSKFSLTETVITLNVVMKLWVRKRFLSADH